MCNTNDEHNAYILNSYMNEYTYVCEFDDPSVSAVPSSMLRLM